MYNTKSNQEGDHAVDQKQVEARLAERIGPEAAADLLSIFSANKMGKNPIQKGKGGGEALIKILNLPPVERLDALLTLRTLLVQGLNNATGIEGAPAIMAELMRTLSGSDHLLSPEDMTRLIRENGPAEVCEKIQPYIDRNPEEAARVLAEISALSPQNVEAVLHKVLGPEIGNINHLLKQAQNPGTWPITGHVAAYFVNKIDDALIDLAQTPLEKRPEAIDRIVTELHLDRLYPGARDALERFSEALGELTPEQKAMLEEHRFGDNLKGEKADALIRALQNGLPEEIGLGEPGELAEAVKTLQFAVGTCKPVEGIPVSGLNVPPAGNQVAAIH